VEAGAVVVTVESSAEGRGIACEKGKTLIRIASFNVENLFERPKAFGSTDMSVAEPILAAHKEVNELIKKPVYTDEEKTRIRELLVLLDIYYINVHNAVRRRDSLNPQWAWLRKNRGDFDREPQDPAKDVEIIAAGRGDWIGWIELAKEPTNELGTRLTAKVIQDVDADILAVIEAEDRPSLVRFNEELLNGKYRHIMLIDGNDDRGIDVAIMTRQAFTIETIRCNVDATDAQGEIFSRDCPQYEILTPGGEVIHVLVNHFKSQSGGGGDKRKRQAKKVRQIVDELVQQGKHVVVLGDLNEGPPTGASHALNLAELYDNASPIADCYSLNGFDVGGRPGTYDSCGLRNRLDYIFLSQSLQQKFVRGEVFRKGLWGSRKTRPDNWTTYPDMTESVEQASDHAAIYVELNI
jgi:endonuclease/exonuclease/phosphatase family metal-dependent hydrolase